MRRENGRTGVAETVEIPQDHKSNSKGRFMSRTGRQFFWGFWIVSGMGWLALNPAIFSASGFFPLREQIVQLSGFLAMAAMSVAMMLSLRPRGPERPFGGLDKMYRLHKWLGIGALILAVTHWLWSNAPKWAVGLGLLAPPERGPRPEITDPVRAFLMSLRGTAEGLGEWAFYATVVLIAIALVKLIPYRPFRFSHRLLPLAYLVLVFHFVVLLDYAMWVTPVGWITAVLLAGGSFAAVISLLGMIGHGRKVPAEIAALNFYRGTRSLEVTLRLGPGWPGHRAGQFAFVTSNKAEGAHPYTIASAWNPEDSALTVVAKELGDHTTGLSSRLKPGQKVAVEGPYGCFTFDDDCPRQIWVAGGIGITPFLARLKEIAANSGQPHPEIDLFHATRDVDEDGLARLGAEAKAAGVHLHLWIEARDGFLTSEAIRKAVPDWREASLWFCGPVGFGKALRTDFAARGFPIERHFHQELFEMR